MSKSVKDRAPVPGGTAQPASQEGVSPPTDLFEPSETRKTAPEPAKVEEHSNGTSTIVKEVEQVTNGSEQPTAGPQLSARFFASINEAMAPRKTLPGFADPHMERVNSIQLPRGLSIAAGRRTCRWLLTQRPSAACSA